MPLMGLIIVHMGILYGTSTRSMAFSFTATCVGFTLGSMLCGLLYDRSNKEFVFALVTLIESLMAITAAFVGDVYSFIVVVTIQGIAVGFLNTGTPTVSWYLDYRVP